MALKLKKVNWKKVKLPHKVNTNWFTISTALIGTDWKIVQYEEKTYKLILTNKAVQLCIYISTMTVQTSMNHPTKGKTQLTRKKITEGEFKQLLINPRLHTGKGKY